MLTKLANRKKYSFVDFAMMTTDEVFDTFGKLDGSEMIVGERDKQRALFIRGKKKNSALMVAHADTVWNDKNIAIGYNDDKNLFYSLSSSGIGADCRSGCQMLWHLKETGNSILILDGEETGCIGARFLMDNKDWRKVINEHCFAIEFDRMHDKDLVYYNVATKSFQKWFAKQVPAYSKAPGMWTDICVLCNSSLHKEDCLDGINISIGYYNQHTPDEVQSAPEWQRTLTEMRRVLGQNNLPNFRHLYEPQKIIARPSLFDDSGSWGDRLFKKATRQDVYEKDLGSMPYDIMAASKPPKTTKLSDKFEIVKQLAKNMILCPKCEGLLEVEDYVENKHCPLCQKAFSV